MSNVIACSQLSYVLSRKNVQDISFKNVIRNLCLLGFPCENQSTHLTLLFSCASHLFKWGFTFSPLSFIQKVQKKKKSPLHCAYCYSSLKAFQRIPICRKILKEIFSWKLNYFWSPWPSFSLLLLPSPTTCHPPPFPPLLPASPPISLIVILHLFIFIYTSVSISCSNPILLLIFYI